MAELEAPPKRKRSRRGSRGGRKRRKPSANGSEETDADAELEPEEAEPDEVVDGSPLVESAVTPEAPGYVPMSEWIDEFESRDRT